MTYYEHYVECLGVDTINGVQTFHIKPNLLAHESYMDYWYSPTKKSIFKIEADWFGIDLDVTLNNCAPLKPSKPDGNEKVKPGQTWSYQTVAIDPNSDRIYYQWDWDGDKKFDEKTTEVYKSGEMCSISHNWTWKELIFGNKKIHVRAIDVNDEVSVWSDPLKISYNLNKPLSQRLYLLKLLLNNIFKFLTGEKQFFYL